MAPVVVVHTSRDCDAARLRMARTDLSIPRSLVCDICGRGIAPEDADAPGEAGKGTIALLHVLSLPSVHLLVSLFSLLHDNSVDASFAQEGGFVATLSTLLRNFATDASNSLYASVATRSILFYMVWYGMGKERTDRCQSTCMHVTN
mmetsp:Transcript_38997/g.79810  ORF Transcript_38997/g.79810 Transcript_38997/m.79810 type:complete len:147 (-) Transcript_38997:261-701(-)